MFIQTQASQSRTALCGRALEFAHGRIQSSKARCASREARASIRLASRRKGLTLKCELHLNGSELFGGRILGAHVASCLQSTAACKGGAAAAQGHL